MTSTRVLVDTLLESDLEDQSRTAEHLELITPGNERLSRLIENFLTFSRIERNQQRFEFQQADARSLAEQAVTTGDRR